MGYAGSVTTSGLHAALNRRLKLEKAETLGRDPEALDEALNAAARRVHDELVRMEAAELVVSKVLLVSQGDASLSLPDGSDPLYPRIRRLREANFQLSSGATPAALDILDPREAAESPELNAIGSWALAREGLKLRWLSASGAPQAGQVTLRYLAALPLVDRNVPSATPFADLSPEWTDIILDLAAAALMPADTAAAARYEQRGAARLEQQTALAQRYVYTQARQLRRVR